MFEEGLGGPGEIVTTISKPGIENAHATQNQHQDVLECLNDTEGSPPLRPMYFAYGSNLSYSQMKRRCANHPEKSAKPVAIARLDKWRWFICERGYANLMPPEILRVGLQETKGENVPVSGKEDAVFGILYDMTMDDEDLLDMYEGVDDEAPDAPPDRKVDRKDRKIRPKEQGDGSYNKWYVPAIVTKWLDGRDEEQTDNPLTVLVYIDEQHVRVGPPKTEYIARMNIAVRESVELGLPNDWAESVIRKVV
ncbi:hypothetical protein V8E54_007680 [Elaphomyces granulatus]|jgi:hypothetical protein